MRNADKQTDITKDQTKGMVTKTWKPAIEYFAPGFPMTWDLVNSKQILVPRQLNLRPNSWGGQKPFPHLGGRHPIRLLCNPWIRFEQQNQSVRIKSLIDELKQLFSKPFKRDFPAK